jgi:hypothetical protein
MADWSVKIVPANSGGGAAFVPDFHGSNAGDPLQAHQDDTVTWDNQTDDDHQPWQTDSNYKPCSQSNISAAVSAGQPSDPYNCSAPANPGDPCSPSIDPNNPPGPAPQTWTIYYYCNRHPDNANERGSIEVAAVATSGVNIIPQGSGATLDPQSRTANQNDLIAWNNTTGNAHQPWPTDASYTPLNVTKGSPQYLADQIPPGETSLTYVVAQPSGNPKTWTVYYYCKLHPADTGERGTIAATGK